MYESLHNEEGMATFYLIRHGLNDRVGKSLAGRLPDVHLNEEGKRQAEALAARLATSPIRRIVSSPLDRAQETALPIARALGLELETNEELAEVRFGGWTGETFAALDENPRWRLYMNHRSGTRPPSGESMLEVQSRVMQVLLNLRARRPEEHIAIVCHADLIRAAMMYFLGMPIDFYSRLEVRPASCSVVEWSDAAVLVRRLNEIAY
jgi:probable phosphoglycerate mutase